MPSPPHQPAVPRSRESWPPWPPLSVAMNLPGPRARRESVARWANCVCRTGALIAAGTRPAGRAAVAVRNGPVAAAIAASPRPNAAGTAIARAPSGASKAGAGAGRAGAINAPARPGRNGVRTAAFPAARAAAAVLRTRTVSTEPASPSAAVPVPPAASSSPPAGIRATWEAWLGRTLSVRRQPMHRR